MRSCRARRVAGASGALPMAQMAMERELGLGEAGVGHDELGHRRHQEHELGPELVDDLEPAAGVELRLVDAEQAELHGVVDEPDAGEGEQRARVQPALARVAGVGRPGDEGHVAVADGHPLGQSRRPRRVEDVGQVVAGHLDLEGRRSSSDPAVAPRPRRVAAPPASARGATITCSSGGQRSSASARRQGRQLGVGQHDPHLGVAEEALELAVGEPGVGGDGHRAGLVDGRVGHHEPQRLLGPQVDRAPGRPWRPPSPPGPGPGGWTRPPTGRRSSAPPSITR